jgi:hypothetical protein
VLRIWNTRTGTAIAARKGHRGPIVDTLGLQSKRATLVVQPAGSRRRPARLWRSDGRPDGPLPPAEQGARRRGVVPARTAPSSSTAEHGHSRGSGARPTEPRDHVFPRALTRPNSGVKHRLVQPRRGASSSRACVDGTGAALGSRRRAQPPPDARRTGGGRGVASSPSGTRTRTATAVVRRGPAPVTGVQVWTARLLGTGGPRTPCSLEERIAHRALRSAPDGQSESRPRGADGRTRVVDPSRTGKVTLLASRGSRAQTVAVSAGREARDPSGYDPGCVPPHGWRLDERNVITLLFRGAHSRIQKRVTPR